MLKKIKEKNLFIILLFLSLSLLKQEVEVYILHPSFLPLPDLPPPTPVESLLIVQHALPYVSQGLCSRAVWSWTLKGVKWVWKFAWRRDCESHVLSNESSSEAQTIKQMQEILAEHSGCGRRRSAY